MPGEVAPLSDRQYRLISIDQVPRPNYTALTATLQLEDRSGNDIATLRPEKRFYPAERQTTTEAAIRTLPSGDDYAVLGDGDDTRGYSFRLYHKPLCGLDLGRGHHHGSGWPPLSLGCHASTPSSRKHRIMTKQSSSQPSRRPRLVHFIPAIGFLIFSSLRGSRFMQPRQAHVRPDPVIITADRTACAFIA